jgi:hypothetical protein
VSLNESIEIQKERAERMKEAQATQAAERLSKTVKIQSKEEELAQATPEMNFEGGMGYREERRQTRV